MQSNEQTIWRKIVYKCSLAVGANHEFGIHANDIWTMMIFIDVFWWF